MIQTEKEYKRKLEQLEKMFNKTMTPAKSKRFEQLAIEIEAYEDIHYPISKLKKGNKNK